MIILWLPRLIWFIRAERGLKQAVNEFISKAGLTRTILGARPSGGLQPSKIVPDNFVIRPIPGPHLPGAYDCVQNCSRQFCDSAHPWASPSGRIRLRPKLFQTILSNRQVLVCYPEHKQKRAIQMDDPFLFGAPGRIRTCDLPLRRGPRYPAVPPGRVRFGRRIFDSGRSITWSSGALAYMEEAAAGSGVSGSAQRSFISRSSGSCCRNSSTSSGSKCRPASSRISATAFSTGQAGL